MKIGYNITNDHTFLNKQNAITPELAAKLVRFHNMALEGKKSSIPKFLQAIKQYPKNPQLKNYLSVLYSNIGNEEKTYEVNHWLLKEHPDYLFAKLNLANEYCINKQYSKVPEVLGEVMELGALYPNRDTFHINEVTGFLKTAILYFAGIGNLEQAEIRYEIMKKIAPDSADADFAFKIIFTARIELGRELSKKEEKNKIRVTTKKQEKSEINVAPVFNHTQINWLYSNGLYIGEEKLKTLLALPRKTLIADLEMVLHDSIVRFSYFNQIAETESWNEETCNFVVHAFFLLGELQANESVNTLLKVLSQSKEYLELFFDDFLATDLWEPLYKIANKNLEVYKQFMFQPSIYTFSKSLLCDTVEQIALHKPKQREEVIEWFKNVIQYFVSCNTDDNIIDSDVIGLLICNILHIEGKELLPDIEKLFEKNIVATEICGTWEAVSRDIQKPVRYKRKNDVLPIIERYTHITTTWAGYIEDEDSYTSLFSDYAPLESIKAEPKIERNAPCPCGSGKKYKKCCLRN